MLLPLGLSTLFRLPFPEVMHCLFFTDMECTKDRQYSIMIMSNTVCLFFMKKYVFYSHHTGL